MRPGKYRIANNFRYVTNRLGKTSQKFLKIYFWETGSTDVRERWQLVANLEETFCTSSFFAVEQKVSLLRPRILRNCLLSRMLSEIDKRELKFFTLQPFHKSAFFKKVRIVLQIMSFCLKLFYRREQQMVIESIT